MAGHCPPGWGHAAFAPAPGRAGLGGGCARCPADLPSTEDQPRFLGSTLLRGTGGTGAAIGEPRQPLAEAAELLRLSSQPAVTCQAEEKSSKGNLGDGISWPERGQSRGVSRV